jgi:guanylate kinase
LTASALPTQDIQVKLHIQRQGVPIVVSSPSGGGKTTMCHAVIDRLKHIEFSVSHTTRPPRAHERNGIDYHFTDRPHFEELIAQEAFLEWAQVYSQLYGTHFEAANKRLAAGIDVLFDIDVQGGRQLLQRLPEAVLIFIVPPTMHELERRLRARKTDAPDQIETRLGSAASEINQATFYTHWIVNDSLEQAIDMMTSIIHAERLRKIDKKQLMRQVLRPDGP